MAAAKAHATRHGHKIVENPAPIVRARIVKDLKKNPSFGVTKLAWVRDGSVPPGKPARGKLNCPCGGAPWSNYADGKDVHCKCGGVYDSEGWVLRTGTTPGVVKSHRAKNPAKSSPTLAVPRRRTFEMFNGREATQALELEVTRHAPGKLD